MVKKIKSISFFALAIIAFVIAGNALAKYSGITEQLSYLFYYPEKEGVVAGEYTVKMAANAPEWAQRQNIIERSTRDFLRKLKNYQGSNGSIFNLALGQADDEVEYFWYLPAYYYATGDNNAYEIYKNSVKDYWYRILDADDGHGYKSDTFYDTEHSLEALMGLANLSFMKQGDPWISTRLEDLADNLGNWDPNSVDWFNESSKHLKTFAFGTNSIGTSCNHASDTTWNLRFVPIALATYLETNNSRYLDWSKNYLDGWVETMNKNAYYVPPTSIDPNNGDPGGCQSWYRGISGDWTGGFDKARSVRQAFLNYGTVSENKKYFDEMKKVFQELWDQGDGSNPAYSYNGSSWQIKSHPGYLDHIARLAIQTAIQDKETDTSFDNLVGNWVSRFNRPVNDVWKMRHQTEVQNEQMHNTYLGNAMQDIANKKTAIDSIGGSVSDLSYYLNNVCGATSGNDADKLGACFSLEEVAQALSLTAFGGFRPNEADLPWFEVMYFKQDGSVGLEWDVAAIVTEASDDEKIIKFFNESHTSPKTVLIQSGYIAEDISSAEVLEINGSSANQTLTVSNKRVSITIPAQTEYKVKLSIGSSPPVHQCNDGVCNIADDCTCFNYGDCDATQCTTTPPAQTCASQGGDICQSGETCPGSIITASDSNNCCDQTCKTNTPTGQLCVDQGGTACNIGEICKGNIIPASDTNTCCDSTCEVIPLDPKCTDSNCDQSFDCWNCSNNFGDCNQTQCTTDPKCMDNNCDASYDCLNCPGMGDCDATVCAYPPVNMNTTGFDWCNADNSLCKMGEGHAPDIAMDSKGRIHVVYDCSPTVYADLNFDHLGNNGGGSQKICYRMWSCDNGISDEEVIGTDHHTPKIIIDKKDNLHVIYTAGSSIAYNKKENNNWVHGTTGKKIINITRYMNVYADMAVDSNNNIYLIFDDHCSSSCANNYPNTGDPPKKIQFIKFSGDGQGPNLFDSTSNGSNIIAEDEGHLIASGVGIDKDDNAYFAWVDLRANSTPQGLWYQKRDTGNSIVDEKQLTNKVSNFAHMTVSSESNITSATAQYAWGSGLLYLWGDGEIDPANKKSMLTTDFPNEVGPAQRDGDYVHIKSVIDKNNIKYIYWTGLRDEEDGKDEVPGTYYCDNAKVGTYKCYTTLPTTKSVMPYVYCQDKNDCVNPDGTLKNYTPTTYAANVDKKYGCSGSSGDVPACDIAYCRDLNKCTSKRWTPAYYVKINNSTNDPLGEPTLVIDETTPVPSGSPNLTSQSRQGTIGENPEAVADNKNGIIVAFQYAEPSVSSRPPYEIYFKMIDGANICNVDPPMKADLNCDEIVNVYDFGIMMSCWDTYYDPVPFDVPDGDMPLQPHCSDESDPEACKSPDISSPSDDKVNVTDLSIMMSCWGAPDANVQPYCFIFPNITP